MNAQAFNGPAMATGMPGSALVINCDLVAVLPQLFVTVTVIVPETNVPL